MYRIVRVGLFGVIPTVTLTLAENEPEMELPESTSGASGELTPGSGIGPRYALSKWGERINGHLRRIK
jgi:hypothetical protein